uniref:Fibronectin type-III domain-containing protein n=1 Tax=Glossina austeni TaxID=7395 RepID=A0A1A9UVP1_GLOAU
MSLITEADSVEYLTFAHGQDVFPNNSFSVKLMHFKVVELIDAAAINSTAVRLDWVMHVSVTEKYVEGLYVRYRDVSANSQQYNIMTVLNPSIESHVVANLKKYTKYEFFLAPFYQTLEGQPSNSKIVQTYEDATIMYNMHTWLQSFE